MKSVWSLLQLLAMLHSFAIFSEGWKLSRHMLNNNRYIPGTIAPNTMGIGRSTFKHANPSALRMGVYSHGEGYKYIPVIVGDDEYHYPRIVHIAGMFPQVTYEQFMAPMSMPPAPQGKWSYDFADPDGPQMGAVAIPGSELVTDAEDPVCLIAKTSALGIKTSEDVEAIVMVDRADLAFSSSHFYVLKDPQGTLQIKWMDVYDPDYEILGKVVITLLPVIESQRKKSSGFLEDE